MAEGGRGINGTPVDRCPVRAGDLGFDRGKYTLSSRGGGVLSWASKVTIKKGFAKQQKKIAKILKMRKIKKVKMR